MLLASNRLYDRIISTPVGRRAQDTALLPCNQRDNSAIYLGYMRSERIRKSKETDSASVSLGIDADCIVCRPYNAPPLHIGWDVSKSLTFNEPLNFTPLRSIPQGFNTLDRASRDVPWESRFDLLQRRISPAFVSDSTGTPRREFQGGMVNGIRVRPALNPHFIPTGHKLKQWNTWRSRDFVGWDALKTSVRGSYKPYDIPGELKPLKNELGEWHPPVVSSRYQADVKRQYILNGIPWIFEKDFMEGKRHLRDREPSGLKRWQRKEYRAAKVREAMKSMPRRIEEYKKDRCAAKRNSWFETVILDMAGEQAVHQIIRKAKLSKNT